MCSVVVKWLLPSGKKGNFSSPSINHYKVPIQGRNSVHGRENGRSRTNSRMQRKRTRIKRAVGLDRLFPSAAAEHVHQLLHYALLLSLLLLSRLLRGRGR